MHLLSERQSPLKEELRVGGVGALFFFFLMRLRKPRVLSLSLGSKRSSSFRLLSRGERSFLGSMGDDTAPSVSNRSVEEHKRTRGLSAKAIKQL